MSPALININVPGQTPSYRGKVRDVYDLGETLIIVATDKLSAFDVVFDQGVPQKGEILTQVALWWFEAMHEFGSHLISHQLEDFPAPFNQVGQLKGRSMWVKKCDRIDFECIVRGYLAGSAYKEYRQLGTLWQKKMPADLLLGSKLPQPLFTPTTKADAGHDEPTTIAEMEKALGAGLTQQIIKTSLELYQKAHDLLAKKGIILADTKFEFGLDQKNKQLVLIDEILTPDSSRYWPATGWQPSAEQNPPAFDKQIVRDYLETLDWDKTPPAPQLPLEIIQQLIDKYKEIESIICTK